MILNDVLDELSFELKRRRVINLCVGPSYTAAILDDQSMGISITLTDGEVEDAGELQAKNAYEVARNLESPMRRSVSLAVMNAISPPQLVAGDPLQLYSGGKLCVFGYSPQVSYEGFSEVVAYDFSPQPVQGAKSFSSFSGEVCTTTVIFGSSFVADHFDKIVSSVKAQHFLLVGVASVYAPVTLKKLGFEAVGKVVPTDRARAFRTVCEGGSARQLNRYVSKAFVKLV